MTEDDYIDIQSMLRACDFYFSDGTKSVIPEIAADFIDRSVNRIEKLEKALHCISLGSQDSGTTKESLGREARKALEDSQ